MQAISPVRSGSPLKPIVVFGAMGFVLALRLGQLYWSVQSPLSYQPGPDEDYYLRFGETVAAGAGQLSPEFTFMDPAYGYLLGALFKLAGVNLFAVYALQCLLDTATAYGIVVIAKLLGRPRAGLYGALLYGASSVALMFCNALLKEVWVTAFVTWWVVGALTVIRSRRALAWLAFGAYCGLGIGLRSTLLLLALMALLLPLWNEAVDGRKAAAWARCAALLTCGVALTLLPWSLRNALAYGGFSPLPHNGGVVLHQIYNEKNPDSAIWIPEFVDYLNPIEIWRGYAAEAARRVGRPLSQQEVDRYWKSEALSFIEHNPARVLRSMLEKTLKFFAASEIPINRSLQEEQLFSPILQWLPAPAPWLLSFGIAGVVWLAFKDRRWPIVAAPMLVALLTVVLFFAEDRFRFHAMAILALCSGIWLDLIVTSIRHGRRRELLHFTAVAAAVGAVSIALGVRNPPAPIRWDHIVWGYINMGKLPDARRLAARIVVEQPANGPIWEALGFTAVADRQFSEAALDYRHATQIRPRSHVAHFDLAKVFLELGQPEQAAAEAKIAVSLYPSPEYLALLSQIQTRQ
jgi:tetratricopeptide (TPR) repeat protein